MFCEHGNVKVQESELPQQVMNTGSHIPKVNVRSAVTKTNTQEPFILENPKLN
jgi:hypothetical protein